ncbi:hypothetical protein FSH19_027350, partial [Escherichia coli]|nr:hypothetical protein [Escherichia coli]
MTSDNIAEYVGENNQFTEKPVTEYPPVIQDNTVTTKDYLYSNNIDTDLLVVIGGLIVILFLMMLISKRLVRTVLIFTESSDQLS